MSTTPFRKISPFITYTPKYVEIIADPNSSGTDLTTFDDCKLGTIWSYARRNAKIEPDRPFLGTRQYDKEKGVYTDYKFISYSEGAELAAQFASGLVELGLKKGDVCTECFGNRAEWLIAELGLFRQGATASPLRHGLNNAYYNHIVIATKPRFGIIAAEKVDDFVDMLTHFNKDGTPITYKAIVVLPYQTGPLYGNEYVTKEQYDAMEALGVRLIKWEEVFEIGKAHPHDEEEDDPLAIHSIIFTSGTTSNRSKGVRLTQRAFVLCNCRNTQYNHFTLYSYVHMSHVGERSLMATAIGTYASIGFPSATLATMFDDIEILKPTLLCTAPIVLKTFQNKAIELIRSGVPEETAKAIFRKKFGGCENCVCSGAPCTQDLAKWVIDFLGMKFSTAYGLTEAAATVFVVPYTRTAPPFGLIGHSCPLVTARIIDVPELGYSIKNDPPCGELLIRSPSNMVDYLDDPERTAAAIDEEKFLHTNDIVKLNDDGSLTVIDRRDNMLKVASSAYIPTENIESVLNTSPLVFQAWVYVKPTENFIVAVIVPSLFVLATDPRLPAELKPQALAAVKDPSSEGAAALCANEAVNKIFMEDIRMLAKKNNFPKYWDIEGIVIDPVPWTEAAGLLTYTNKVKRKALTEKYHERLDAFMAELRDKVKIIYNN